MIKYIKFKPQCPSFLWERASELAVKVISLFIFTLGVWTPRWQQITEAGWLWIGHHCGWPPVHRLWHPNIRGSRNHCGDRVSAFCVFTEVLCLQKPVCFKNRRHRTALSGPDRVSYQISFTCFTFKWEPFSQFFQSSCQLLQSSLRLLFGIC